MTRSLLIAALAASLAAAAMGGEGVACVTDAFAEANAVYRAAADAATDDERAARYREAADMYASVAERCPNGHALYNLGNARFRAGEYGRAVAAYRRALELMPRHGGARRNLAMARQSAPGGGAGREPHPAAAAFFFWHYAVSAREAEAVAAAAFALMAAAVGAWGYAPERLRPKLRAAGSACGVVFLAFALSAAAKLGAGTDEAVVVVREAKVRSEPAGRAVELFTLREGAEMDVLGRAGAWTRVRLGERRGWVESRAIEVLSEPPFSSLDPCPPE